VDKNHQNKFIENIVKILGERTLNFLVIHHLEPDHSASIKAVIQKFPGVKIVCNQLALNMMKQFYEMDDDTLFHVVREGDTLETGRHSLNFVMAPMVHWIEVMVTYDATDKILFSADGFGTFGALNGAIFADEVDFMTEYLDEARRYYTNIVGKYGNQVQSLLGKAATLEINMICPLHGFVWRKNLTDFIAKYDKWSRYEPEIKGVMICYGSVYGNTETAAEILAAKLLENGIKCVMYDVSVTDSAEIIAAAFKWSHFVFASTTYNAGIFIKMEELINDLVAHNIQNRTVAIIENGSWAATSGNLIKKELFKCQKINFLKEIITIKSSLKEEQLSDIENLAGAIKDNILSLKSSGNNIDNSTKINTMDMFKLTYGLFLISTKNGNADNACIINTVMQITEKPLQINAIINKANLTHDLVKQTGAFNISILTNETPFNLIKHFGYRSGRDVNKFDDTFSIKRSSNGLFYLDDYNNGTLSAKVSSVIDCETHSLFIAEVTETINISSQTSLTYKYYFDHIKPAPPAVATHKKGYLCKICNYVYDGDTLPEDYICPLCKHGVADFVKIQ
jgi:flavorubredoxin/flavin reductase (DIM6/NTAB) family NADH-FMN oxidoreductase RutF